MSPGLSSDHASTIVAALADFECVVIYLFGSRATGKHRPNSDLDIAFLSSRRIEPVECFNLANELSNQIGKEVELVDLSTASTVLAKEVIAHGIPISITDPSAYRTFEMYTLSSYARLNEERREILAL